MDSVECGTRCKASAPGKIIRNGNFILTHNFEVIPDPDKVIHIPCSDSFSIIVQLRDFSSHRLWNGKKLIFDGGHPQKSVSIAYLGDEIRCQHRATYENVRFMLPRTSIKEFLYEEGMRTSAEPERIIGLEDPVTYHLAMALLPSFANSGERNELFVEQLMLALLTHVQVRFISVGEAQTSTGKGLAPWQLRRAKELIAGHLVDGVSVARLAEECGLSRSYFTKAFKRSTGFSPHEWLMHMRVDRAKEMMLCSDEVLSQISVACGFSDQPHFSRIFLRLTGVSPATWRRVKRQKGDSLRGLYPASTDTFE
ncbi:helix-turn-helix domain-containing protein [Pseudomonas aeruginosa]|uniref:helix-turn-helix domain-containing protein n=1 Tax=Pseudomonas aeruginosa TaxID=287 RepID=UPI0011B77F35|nr:AraC family transcriptional regulator [Pseudomonas aeruginosa]EKV6491972.1 helix-turn-helix transcriptional regulator [Pseudomonas aeruginosa]TWW48426.1 helix-turn-helix transcriptional regulator [Pseudomonas aeruginosa]TWY05398.1 helix-turn-helix transcriptional regulator [Pseudomonas aeruginosa]